MCTIKIKRTYSGGSGTLTRGELAFDYFTNTLFVGNASNVGIPIGREIYGETGADLFLEAYDNAWPTQESAKAYIDSILGPYTVEQVSYEYLGITANGQQVADSLTTDTVISWANSTIYEETDNIGIKIYDANDIWQDFAGFFQDEEDIMYLKVSYSLVLSDVGEGAGVGDSINNASRFCAIKLINKKLFGDQTFTYYGVQKIPPCFSSRLLGGVRYPTMVSGSAVVPLPRRTSDDPWEIQIVTRWKTNAPSGNSYVGKLNPSSADDFVNWEKRIFGEEGATDGAGINIQIRRLFV